MFCSQCGAKAAGKFCSSCGAPLLAVVPPPEPVDPGPPIDWRNTVDYQTLLSAPEVQERLTRSSAQSKKRMTGEEILDMYGGVLGKLSGVPLPMGKLAPYVQSMAARLGMKTGKSRSEIIPGPPGAVLAALLCSLARNGRTLRSVEQLADGCVLTAELPSDLWALEGDLVIAVVRQTTGTRVDVHTDIRGQIYDWGKSTRCLAQLFEELSAAAA